MKISYQEILSNAWQITWHNKILWFFGIFASFISLEAVYEILSGQISLLSSLSKFQNNLLADFQDQTSLADQLFLIMNGISQDALLYLFFLIAIIVVFIFIWLVFTSQVFLIKSAAKLYQHQNLHVRINLADSTEKFWPVLGINVLSKLIIYAGYLFCSLPLIYGMLNQDAVIINAGNVFFFIIFTILAITISFLTAFATNYIVLKNLHILEAYTASWRLFKKNIVLSLEIALILFVLKILSLIILLSLGFIVITPFAILWLLNTSSANILGMVMSLTMLIIGALIVTLLVNAIYTVFYLSSWTITFLQISEQSIFGRLLAYLETIPLIFNKMKRKYNLQIEPQEINQEAKKLARKTVKEISVLAAGLEKEYKKYKPTIKKQSLVMAKKISQAYDKYQPRLEKEIEKIIAVKKTTVKSKSKSRRKIAKKK